MNKQYVILVALLFVSFGFTSAFAESNIQSELNVQTEPSLINRPFSLDQIVISSPFDFRDDTANMLAIFLLAVPFGAIVYRMADHDPIPQQTIKLSSVVVFFAMASMIGAPLSIGNSMWGYAYASSVDSLLDVPTPIESVYFDFSNSEFSNNGASTILDNKNSAILLDGQNDYLVLDSTLPSKLKHFSVSAWVKPDYKTGAASTLSVLSEADAFDLSINNNKIDKNIAVFSVYDGMKWHTVESQTAIPENWTHLSATFSNNSINISVNGVQENSKKIDGQYSLTSEYGVSTQNDFEYLSLKSDVLIGAFNPSLREESSTQNHFSGLIDDVTFYDKPLFIVHVSELHDTNRTPDVLPVLEFASITLAPQPIGTVDKYGFVTDEDNPNEQKIESTASEGYKVKKPVEKKKKPAPEPEPEPEPSTAVSTTSDSSTESTTAETEATSEGNSEQTKLIEVSAGLHLDSDRNPVADIFDEISAQDNVWTNEIPVDDYVRVTFEQAITNTKDITVYAMSNGTASIDVYDKDGTEIIATFDTISEESLHTIYLTNLNNGEKTFDLKITGASIQFDLIVDPPGVPTPKTTNFEQCSNDNGSTPAGQCEWIGSIVQQSNSIMFEDMQLPQRLIYTGIDTNGDHTIGFSYEYSKGGIHAFDWVGTVDPGHVPLTGYVQGVTENQDPGQFDPGMTQLAPCDNLITGSESDAQDACFALVSVAGDGTAPYLPRTDELVIISDPFDSKDSPPGTSQAAKELAWRTQYPGDEGNVSYITGYGTGDFSFVDDSMTLTHNPESDVSDSMVRMEFKINFTDCEGDTTCDVILFWGGHLAAGGTDDLAMQAGAHHWGLGIGSSTIKGGPYHQNQVKFNGQGGSLDNQIKGSDIILPVDAFIKIIKITTDTSTQNVVFTFDISGDDTINDIDADIFMDGHNAMTEIQRVDAGTYTVTENAKTGWKSLTGDTPCTVFETADIETGEPDLGSPVAGKENISATAIQIDPSETAVCTFTNDNTAFVKIIKTTDKNVSGNHSFDFLVDQNGGTDPTPQLTVEDGTNTIMSDLIMVPTGSTSITETTADGVLFKFDSVECGIGTANDNGNDPATFNNDATLSDGGNLNIVLEPWEVLVCEFTNDNTAFVKIIKTTDKNVSGNHSFDFLVDQNGGTDPTPQLTVEDGTNTIMSDLIMVPTGSTTITETTADSVLFKFDQVACAVGTATDNGDDPATYNNDVDLENDLIVNANTEILEPWEVLVCEFINDNTAFVKIIKTTTKPVASNESIDFTITPSVGNTIPETLTVLQTESTTMSDLIMVPTGSTDVEEDPLGNDLFKLTSVACAIGSANDNGDGTATYNDDVVIPDDLVENANLNQILEPWEVLVCEFTNDNTAFIKILKETAQIVDEDVKFHFEVRAPVDLFLSTSLTVITGSSTAMISKFMVPTGTYNINETNLPEGWRLVGTPECNVWDVTDDGEMTKIDADMGADENPETPKRTVDNVDLRLAPWEFAECTFTNNIPREGLTPGFWRANAQNWDAGAWPQDPEGLFKDNAGGIFGPNNPGMPDFHIMYHLDLNPNFDFFDEGTSNKPTLFGAIAAQGGDVNALARHCVAAKLNAEHPDIDYPVAKENILEEIIEPCRDALNDGDVSAMNALKDIFAGWNEAGADIPGGQQNDQGNNWTPS